MLITMLYSDNDAGDALMLGSTAGSSVGDATPTVSVCQGSGEGG